MTNTAPPPRSIPGGTRPGGHDGDNHFAVVARGSGGGAGTSWRARVVFEGFPR